MRDQQHNGVKLEVPEPGWTQGSPGPFTGSEGMYSIKEQFKGATVMITGASGYIGSLVLEQLLRTTEVKKIYVLIRGKRGCPAPERLARLLQSGLFHLVRDRPKLLSKVALLEGDMSDEELGLSSSDLDSIIHEVNLIIHSAASIELEADVQHTLRSNYQGTHRLLQLASSMQQLRGFVHVSTAYVNVNQPPGGYVEERFYPLRMGEQAVCHGTVVDDLMSLEPDSANVRAQMFLDMWGFPNTYTMGKHLTEKLVAEFHGQGLPVCIVRPTLVCGVAGLPYPGYTGNLAGPIGMGLAMAVGLFDSLGSVAMVPTHVWDAIPGDMVASVVLAAAAVRSARLPINEYRGSSIGSDDHPMIFHAGTSTTYPISFAEAQWACMDFIAHNPPPFKLPSWGGYFRVPLDYRPDPKTVAKHKAWIAWKVSWIVRLMELLGQNKTARRLRYGHIAWQIQNTTKTDRNLFFGSKNLLKLQELLAPDEQEEFPLTWTLKQGGWRRYSNTSLAGLYRQIFGISEIKGLKTDFRFIPSREPPTQQVTSDTAPTRDQSDDKQAAEEVSPMVFASPPREAEFASPEPSDLVMSAAGGLAVASLATVPADGRASWAQSCDLSSVGSTPEEGVRAGLRLVPARSTPVGAVQEEDAAGLRGAISAGLVRSLSTKMGRYDEVGPRAFVRGVSLKVQKTQ